MRAVPVARIVGSVGRWRELGADFFPAARGVPRERYERVGRAMRAGTPLPPLELYRLAAPGEAGGAPAAGEYSVVDGHHRVAMARRLGQDFLDAHVVAYTVAAGRRAERAGGLASAS